MRQKATASVLSAAALVGGLCLGATTAAASSPSQVTLAGTASPLVTRAPAVTGVTGDTPLSFQVVLGLRQRAQAATLVEAVSTPGNPSYRRYLTPAQWDARFSPTVSQVGAVTAWLRSQRLTVTTVSANRTTIDVSGAAATVAKAFKTALSERRFAGRTLRTVDRNLTIPASLSGIVVGTVGLTQSLATPSDSNGATTTTTSVGPDAATAGQGPTPVPPPPAYVTSPPCGTYFGQKHAKQLPPYPGYPDPQPWDTCGYTPPQVRSAYGLSGNVAAGDDGKGVTVAIVDAYASPTLFSDAQTYSKNSDPRHVLSSSQFSEIFPAYYDEESACGASGWFTEQSLDVESVHDSAPGANILYVGASDCTDSGLLAGLQNVVQGDLANIITDSWGDTAGDLLTDAATKTAYDDTFMQAAAEGISVLFSSGDFGDNFPVAGFTSPDYPASSPYVTAVGGTTLEIGSSGQRLAEYGWSTAKSLFCDKRFVGVLPGCTTSTEGTWLPAAFDYGGGGGASYYYAEPSYQTPVVPAQYADENAPITGTPTRVVPDVAALADPSNGFLMGATETFPDGTVAYGQFREGGTSLASPTMAGVFALADQAAHAGLGFLNPTLYQLYSSDRSAYYDVIPPSGPASEARTDYYNSVNASSGVEVETRIVTYEGPETYCNGAGNCATRNVTLSTSPGYDNMTGLGTPAKGFVAALVAGAKG